MGGKSVVFWPERVLEDILMRYMAIRAMSMRENAHQHIIEQ